VCASTRIADERKPRNDDSDKCTELPPGENRKGWNDRETETWRKRCARAELCQLIVTRGAQRRLFTRLSPRRVVFRNINVTDWATSLFGESLKIGTVYQNHEIINHLLIITFWSTRIRPFGGCPGENHTTVAGTDNLDSATEFIGSL
jgi:hypothetical protein